jgi:hypothetical protein
MKSNILPLVALTLTSAVPACLAAPASPSVDTLKQALTRKLQSLLPVGMTERNVLFQDVRTGASSGGFYPFQVTALIRDYGPGYPKNRFYGQTCVSRLNKVTFTMSADQFGEWQVEGAMTPPLDTQQCKPNPAAGVSSIPLAGLQGSPAPTGNPTPAAPATANKGLPTGQPAPTGGVAAGSYECWANGSARMLLNFTIRTAAQYTGSDGKPGSYGYDANTGRITFKGGALDGAMPDGFYAIYQELKGVPTVSFRSPRGAEASFCQKAR